METGGGGIITIGCRGRGHIYSDCEMNDEWIGFVGSSWFIWILDRVLAEFFAVMLMMLNDAPFVRIDSVMIG